MKMKHILLGILLLGIIAALSSCSAELRIQRKQYKEQKLPPGQVKKVTGSKSAAPYAPGHNQ